MKELLFILGTRPEAIKLAPLIMEFKSRKNYNVTVCNTEQQKDLSNQTLDFFELKADIRGLLKILSLQDRCFGEFLGVYTKKMG